MKHLRRRAPRREGRAFLGPSGRGLIEAPAQWLGQDVVGRAFLGPSGRGLIEAAQTGAKIGNSLRLSSALRAGASLKQELERIAA